MKNHQVKLAVFAVLLCCIVAQAAAAKCTVNGCRKCAPDDPSSCAKCKKGYERNENAGTCNECANGYGTRVSPAVAKAPKGFPKTCDAPTNGAKATKATCRCRRCPRGTTSTGGLLEYAECTDEAKGQVVGGQPQASLELSNCGVAQACNVKTYDWGVVKTASPSIISVTAPITSTSSAQNATWTITVTKSPPKNVLKVMGGFTIYNSGEGDAPIVNVVVNLQKKIKGDKWKTIAMDAVDAAHGDLSLPMYNGKVDVVVVSGAASDSTQLFLTTHESGKLEVLNEDGNPIASLEDVKIARQDKLNFFYLAAFNLDNPIDPSSTLRAEVIVTFDNAGKRGSGVASSDIDIDSDGVKDNIRSVPCREAVQGLTQQSNEWHKEVTLTDKVTLANTLYPGPETGDALIECANIELTLNDVVKKPTLPYKEAECPAEITTTLDANATIQVTASVTAGGEGDQIRNEAHIFSAGLPMPSGPFEFMCVDDVDVTSSDFVTIDVDGQEPPTVGSAYYSYTQGGWGQGGNPNQQPDASLYEWFNEGNDAIIVGGTYKMTFTSADAIRAYLPAKRPASPGALSKNLDDPTSSPAGVFGGQVLTLHLNVRVLTDLDNLITYGSLDLCSIDGTNKVITKSTKIGEFLTSAEAVLGGENPTPATIDDYNKIADWLNNCCHPTSGGKPICTNLSPLPSNTDLGIYLSANGCP